MEEEKDRKKERKERRSSRTRCRRTEDTRRQRKAGTVTATAATHGVAIAACAPPDAVFSLKGEEKGAR